MHKIYKAQIKDLLNIKKIIKDISNKADFYSEFKESIIKYIIKQKCYIISDNNRICCIFIISDDNEVYVMPKDITFSFFKFLYILSKHFKNNDFKLKIKYKKLNIDSYKKYYKLKVIDNYLCMFLDVTNNCCMENKDELVVRKMKIDKDENIRVNLQNKIFSNIKGRRDLTLNEVFFEESSSKFLKDYCYFLEYYDTPVGYGQIIKIKGDFFLVNFGIIPEFQGRGFGAYFLNKIVENCNNAGINKLYLTVDGNNKRAVNLYRNYGFKFMYGDAKLILYS
ncbi:MAG: GNAT family N-acetyltransferase [Caloramator sp.]|nr:GNAT family N-acetyltransferase [Caloramator sp.]